ncbi:helix-turn-helix domain-containing protein [Nocardia sp. NPDC088792]|uniref:helix-turn-helix domain-containing protein n=1 Tax=Nocardia sp. NPDC088792 TaxID=3364332 RepID=UPI003824707B
MGPLELLSHPVRMRILHAFRGRDTLTTAELGTLLPDVSKAMLYRHVDTLASAGILEVAEERRVRGAVQRHYRLQPARTVAANAEALESLSPEDHRQVFATAMTVLIAEFNAYLDREHADPVADLVGYRQHGIWLTHEELAEFEAELRRVILPRLANQPTPERGRYLLSPIIFPAEAPAGETG